MKIIELFRDICIKQDLPREDIEVLGISSSSCDTKPGDIFVCIEGLRTDGHRFAREAVERGAVAVLCESGRGEEIAPDLPEGVLCFETENTRRALSFLWHRFCGCPSRGMQMIGVTGTNGKTSVTFMLKAILDSIGVKTGLIGTVKCLCGDKTVELRSSDRRANMTTPDPGELYRILAQMRGEGVETVIMEVTSHALALSKLAPLHFDFGLFTNLTPDHLDFHGNMEEYFNAKKRLFCACDTAVINCSDRYGRSMAEFAEGHCRRVVRCGEGQELDYSAEHVNARGVDGVEYILNSISAIFKITSPIPGNFTVSNTLLAASAALEMSVLPSSIRIALASMRGIDGRLQRVKICHGADFSVFIDYAHTPDALENLLRTAKSARMAGQRIVLLFGCGGDRDKSKRPVMGRIASTMADLVIVTSDNSRSERTEDITAQILSGVDFGACSCVVIPDRKQAIEYAISNALSGDIILLAGKGHEKYEINEKGVFPFDEEKLACEFAEKYYG